MNATHHAILLAHGGENADRTICSNTESQVLVPKNRCSRPSKPTVPQPVKTQTTNNATEVAPLLPFSWAMEQTAVVPGHNFGRYCYNRVIPSQCHHTCLTSKNPPFMFIPYIGTRYNSQVLTYLL